MTPITPFSNSDRKTRIVHRLRRLEGQVRGLQKMVEEERSCREILTLLSGVKSALDAVGEEILEAYLHQCQADPQAQAPGQLVEMVRLLRR
ncbi:MAG: metal-sensitive transcriptional regulator [Meiothermus sp.]|uniref:metal-sensitive transcriptional regulator n=1 Tax=Meiothermus sp. TaxID=1955249 RepID=UPI0025D83B24|nr:metal-sensitive transcriptional regulator [Meiothermus sp.]MCS7058834.1 metal-sensitive transcriptional regulator [Meiothermus sp.]MCS7194066.1 metal-sensitive transcriptional regulator [Meiothermus sp.]MCX7740437.1 metal-sensitive transcriptional regulator [Meiothermus sp.]MDW8091159.1 metal-sensitive transcriptional regulator [Meiothermus sp.]MDW8480465.1 metal-sensitive transcriptional regulator [Meiothermus sp.]